MWKGVVLEVCQLMFFNECMYAAVAGCCMKQVMINDDVKHLVAWIIGYAFLMHLIEQESHYRISKQNENKM